MSGGTISGNSIFSYSPSCGGVYLSSGTFEMSGGTISGNMVFSYSPSSSSAFSCGGGGVYVASGTFTMGGGAISGNTAERDVGGGVYVEGNTLMLGGGTVYGKGAGANANAAPTGASLAIKDSAAIAKYGNFGDILESGLATDETLVGKE